MYDDTTAPRDEAAGEGSTITPWLDYRRKRFWAIILVLLYTLAGFFLVPALVSHLLVKNVEEKADREASVSEVRFNPYVLSLQLNGFELTDTDGERLAAFDELFVNFQLSSLFRWALTFREFRLDGAYLLHEQFGPGDSRLTRLLADIERLNPDSGQSEEETGGLPRLLVHDLILNEGSFLFRDHSPGETVEVPAGPVTIDVHDLNTLPDRDGMQNVQIRLAGGALLTWQGDLALEPLVSTGSLSLEGSELKTLAPYLKAILPLESIQARLAVRTDYAIRQNEEGALSVSLSGLETQLEDVALTGLVPASEFLAFDAFEIRGGELHYPESRLLLKEVRILNPFVDAWLGEDGQPGLLQLLPPASPDAGQDDTSATPWSVSIDAFSIEGGRIAVADRSLQPNAELEIDNLALELSGIDLEDNTSMPLSARLTLAAGGELGFEGNIVALPDVSAGGAFTAKDIPLSLAQPYIQQHLAVAVENGALRAATEFELDPSGDFRTAGELEIAGLAVLDTSENKPLLAWERMFVDRFEVDSAATSAGISSVRFTKPYGRIHIREDLSTNIGDLPIESGEKETPPVDATEPGAPSWSAVLGGIAIDDGSMDFSDFSLPLPFATKINGLDGTLSTIDSNSGEPTGIRLEGGVDEFGLARIEGTMNLFDPIRHSDVSVEFRNLLMTSLSPYSAQFAGRKIDEGKLDLDLLYRIEGGQLNGQNSVVLSDLVLGDEVDSPDAVSLPLGLAVALLKNSEGVIDIDVPVEGDVNDPEFKIGGVIWKAFAGLITKVVAAPFKLLGSLIGIESEDFGQFQFLAGRADLTPPEMEKIGQLQEALAQRPELGLEINGAYVADVDTPALQYASLRATVLERLGRDPVQEGNSEEMLDKEVRGVLEALYVERFPDSPLEELRAAHRAAPVDEPEAEPVFDETAYSGELRDRLLTSETIGAAELEALATQRAQAVTEAFLAGGLDPARITQGEPTESESEGGEWVIMELGVATE